MTQGSSSSAHSTLRAKRPQRIFHLIPLSHSLPVTRNCPGATFTNIEAQVKKYPYENGGRTTKLQKTEPPK